MSLRDQSLLISTVDLSLRARTEAADTRMVLRESYYTNYLSTQRDRNRLTAAYFERGARDRHYLYRLGRQTGTGGGVPGRFDGAWVGYSPNTTWRVNGVLGAQKVFDDSGIDAFVVTPEDRRTFAGVSVDLTRLPDQMNGSVYLIQENADNVIAERRAIGTEMRYFDARRNYIGLLDYDTLFKALNIAMFQGSWTAPGGTNFNLYADHRKSPSLRLSNALIGQTCPSGQACRGLNALRESGVTTETLFADARALSPNSNTLMFAVNYPYTANVRLSTDLRVSNLSGFGATSAGPSASPDSGNAHTYSMQATANNLFLENDLGVANVSYTLAKTYRAQSVAFTQVETFRRNWRLDMFLMFYRQKDVLGTEQTQIRPRLKLNYRWNDSVSLECEGGLENTHTQSLVAEDTTRRKYFFVGYRWDFR